jgi:glycosyltransferase involved in cell wall biosynthesis
VADRPLRVLRVIARMNVGGPALQVSGLMDGLDPARFTSELVTGFVDEGEADFLDVRAPHLRARRIDGLGRSVRPTSDVAALARLVAEVRRFRPDIVHTHTAKAGVLGRLAAKTARVPGVVHTFHGHLLHGYFSPAVTRAVVQTERMLARGSTRLVAVGQQVRDDLLAAGIGTAAKYVVVPPGLHLPAAPPRAESRRLLDLPADGPVVTLVARLTSIKRPERFVAVAEALAARHPAATFVICGEGDLLGALREQAAPLGARVRFLGWRADVETVYAATDVVVLTSDNEGMPVSLIEAAMCGVPAVTTDVGSAAEVVLHEQTGLLVPVSVPALVDAVDQLLTDDALRARLAAAGGPRARSLFGVERLVADTERLYEDIAREKGLPRS